MARTRTAKKTVNRRYKDAVFRRLFSDKRVLLSLYNAVRGTDYENPDDLRIETLDNAVYMKVKNDLSFVVQSRLELYEHQSTVNVNLPLRNLFYVADVLQRITENVDLHLKSPQYIPTPGFIVFYNGVEDQPERVTLRLSELFEVHTDEPQLELIVTQININQGYNAELLQKCRELGGYSIFVSKIRERIRRGESIQSAVPKVIDECIAEGILADFLRREKAEVTAMSIYEYDEEWHLANVRKEAREEERKRAEAEINDLKKELEALRDAGTVPSPIYQYDEERHLENVRKEAREEGIAAGREEERVNTLRERARADNERTRADAAEARADSFEKLCEQYRQKYGELS